MFSLISRALFPVKLTLNFIVGASAPLCGALSDTGMYTPAPTVSHVWVSPSSQAKDSFVGLSSFCWVRMHESSHRGVRWDGSQKVIAEKVRMAIVEIRFLKSRCTSPIYYLFRGWHFGQMKLLVEPVLIFCMVV